MSSSSYAIPIHTVCNYRIRQGAVVLCLAIMLLSSWGVPRTVQAITILFEATDLAPPGPGGGDLWQYTLPRVRPPLLPH